MTDEPKEKDSTQSSIQSSEKISLSPPASVYSASGARPVHSASGFPHRDRRSLRSRDATSRLEATKSLLDPNESTTNPPFIEYDGGSRSNPGLPLVREPTVPVQERPSWSTLPPENRFLNYGDIIQIYTEEASSSDIKSSLNEKTFLVDYLDDDQIRLVNTNTFEIIRLAVDEDGNITDTNIKRIELLTRAKEPGFARQKGLVVDQWVDVYFIGIDSPITGKVTNLEEDQIELTLHPSMETIYLDFRYRGLPEDLGIEKFVLRSSPPSLVNESVGNVAEEPGSLKTLEEGEIRETASITYTDNNEAIIVMPENPVYDPDYREVLQADYFDANEIFFGKDQDVVEQFVELTTHEKVYSLDTQLNSLMNELLSEIPNTQRTHEVMGDIHRLLERFKELREQFSNIDPLTNQVLGYHLNGQQYKPLLETLKSGHVVPPSWLIPVTQIRRKMYSNPEAALPEEMGDTQMIVDKYEIRDMNNLVTGKTQGGNVNPYIWMIQEVDPYFTPTSNLPIEVSHKSVLFQQTVEMDGWESIVDNGVDREYTASSAAVLSAENMILKPSKFTAHRYNMGTSFLERCPDKRSKFTSTLLTPSESMTIQSWIAMPYSVAQFSRIRLPNTDIMARSILSDQYWMKYRTFTPRHNTNITRGQPDDFIIENLDTNVFSTRQGQRTEDKGKKPEDSFASKFLQASRNSAIHFVLDPTIVRENTEMPEEIYHAYLNSITPNTYDLIEMIEPRIPLYHGFTVPSFMEYMEPFLVYTNDITYTQFNRIRYYMHKRIADYRKIFQEGKDKYQKIAGGILRISNDLDSRRFNPVHSILDVGSKYDSIFKDVYKIPGLIPSKEGVSPARYVSGSEILREMTHRDTSNLFSILIQSRMIAHVISESILAAALEDYEDAQEKAMNEPKVGKSSKNDCNARTLTKLYASLGDLQKDNNTDAVFRDPEFDDTPYSILDAYKADMPTKVSPDAPEMKEFLELLEVNLIKKHACSKENAPELAYTLVSKKNPIKEGEYAILEEVYPFDGLDDERRFYPHKRNFYKRIKNRWVEDNSVEEESFADLAYLVNAAFSRTKKLGSHANVQKMICDTQETCAKRPMSANASCDPTKVAQDQIRRIRQKYAVEEMEKRLQMTQKELETWVEDKIIECSRRVAAMDRLRYVTLHKSDLFAIALGKIQADMPATSMVTSPHAALFDMIMGQDDMYKKQFDIVRMVKRGLVRRAMKEELGEDLHWYYCTETNTKLLPAFLYDLAYEYITYGESRYQDKLAEIKKFQVISDDGDAIVDKHSGYVISKIEFVREELFDEHGFKIQTSRVMEVDEDEDVRGEEDSDEHPATVLDQVNINTAFFAEGTSTSANVDTMTPMVRNIFFTFCRILEIPAKIHEQGLQEFVTRVSLEWLQESMLTQEAFTALQTKKMDPSKIPERYIKYSQQYTIIIVTAIFLIGIQTAQPRIPTKKTVPGCVRSFSGYPLTESVDDQSGIEYMACILNIIKSSIPPWDTIQKANKVDLVAKIQEKIAEILTKRQDVYELYLKEREYRVTHPEEFEIPEEHQLTAWRGLYPPIVDIGVIERLPIEREDVVKPTTLLAQSKAIRYSCGIIEAIHGVVQKKDVLLKSSLGIPFVQNSCCNTTTTATKTTLQYFIQEAPTLTAFLGHVEYYGKIVDANLHIGRSATWVSTIDTRILRKEVISGNTEELIYHSFIHHCLFDRIDQEIPLNLQSVCVSKPAEGKYNRKSSLREKIQALKEAGRDYHVDDFENLIRKVNASHLVPPYMKIVTPNAIQLMIELLAQGQESIVSDVSTASGLDQIRSELLAVLVKYDPQVMIMEKQAILIKYNPELMVMGAPEQNDDMPLVIMKLKNKLAKLNDTMKKRIEQFIRTYGGLKKSEFTKMKDAIEQISQWSSDASSESGGAEFYELGQFIRNSVTSMVKIIPEMILNRSFHQIPTIHKHWKLAEEHVTILEKIIQSYMKDYLKFANNEEDDPVFSTMLRNIQGKLMDMVLLIQLLPIQKTIQRGEDAWFRLFDRSTTALLLSYIWYSVFDQYIESCTEFTKKNTFIMVGEKLKTNVAGLLVAYLRTNQSDKSKIDQSYEMIMKKVNRAKDKEKEEIMRGFENADKKDRRFMFLEKMWKHGRWNVGIQNGLVKYDKKRFDSEIRDMDLDIDADREEEGDAELDSVNDDADYEEHDLEELGEDYMDGDHYGEDDDDLEDFEDA